MNECLNHVERDADFVCSVCGRYYCGDCVEERFYPKPGYICLECSGTRPAPAPEPPSSQDSVTQAPDSQTAESLKQNSSQSRLALTIEWAVIGACLLLILGLAAYRYGGGAWKPELLLAAPEHLASYCLSMLNIMETQETALTLGDVLSACPDPINVSEADNTIVVTTPDADLYGFNEIEITLDPVAITVME